MYNVDRHKHTVVYYICINNDANLLHIFPSREIKSRRERLITSPLSSSCSCRFLTPCRGLLIIKWLLLCAPNDRWTRLISTMTTISLSRLLVKGGKNQHSSRDIDPCTAWDRWKRVQRRHTWLSEPDVEDLVHLWIVGSDVKDVVGLILNAGNVDRHQILGDLLPSNRSSAAGAHVKHFSPQPLNTTQKYVQSTKGGRNVIFVIFHFKKLFKLSKCFTI